jgi:hypothetical protein
MPPPRKSDGTIGWLLAGDPAIRWQTLQDLRGAPDRSVARERAKVAREGWGERLLGLQDKSGTWAGGPSADGGLYTPKWISTTYTMLLLRDFGLAPDNSQAAAACRLLLDRGIRRDGGIGYGESANRSGQGETCITGMVLSILAYFAHDDERVDRVAAHVVDEQMADGGWNCRRRRGATHSSVHTTISVLEGLRHYGEQRARLKPRAMVPSRAIAAAQQRGREFLLAHRLFRSHRTGAIIHPVFLRFAFPPRWHYDVLRALDYFQAVDAPRDPRLAEAIEIVRKARREDGTWALQHEYKGKTYFRLESVGAPSRWNTLRALRVLTWWERGTRRH